MGIDVFVGARHQPNAHQGERKSDQLNPVGQALGAKADQHRQDSGHDGGHGRHHSHAADGQRPVEGRDAKGSQRNPRMLPTTDRRVAERLRR